MLKKLRIKFVLINMALVTVMLCIIFALVYHFTAINLETESIDMMKDIAAHPSQLTLPTSPDRDVRLPYFMIQLNYNGSFTVAANGYFDLSDRSLILSLIDEAYSSPENNGIIDQYNLRYYRSSTPAEQCLVFTDISSELTTLNNLLKTSILIGILSFTIFLLISLLLAHWAVKPVDRAWQQQRQFVADASHELKTPLTVILTDAELMQNSDNDPVSMQRFSSDILTMARQMRGLVEELLELARADNRQNDAPHSKLDFSKLVYDATLPFEPVFFEKGLELQTEIEPNLFVIGDSAKLHRVVDILLDNAQKYSHDSGRVNVRLEKPNRSHCILAVSNPGDELSPEQLKNIFKRFYRADEARSRDGSFGLGLSIAQTIAAAHHGRIWAESKNGINTFFVELPLT